MIRRLSQSGIFAALFVCSWPITTQTSADISHFSRFSVRSNYSSSNELLDDEKDFYGIAVQAKSKINLTEALNLNLDGRLGSDDVSREGYSNSELSELFFRYETDYYDLTLGRKVISWGKADAINPTDVVSPKNYLILLSETADQRKGSDGALLSWYLRGSDTLELGILTQFEASDIVLPSSFGVDFNIDDKASVNWENPALLMKYSQGFRSLDWSVYAYDGQNSLPEASAVEPADRPLLYLRYPTLHMFGSDFAGVWRNYTYRGEIAYKDFHPDAPSPGFGRYLNIVAGFERKYDEYLTLGIQYLVNRKLDVGAPSTSAWINSFNNLIQATPKETVRGMTLRLSDAWKNGFLKAEVFTVYYFSDNSYFYQLSGDYAVSDRISTKLGYRGYAGSDISLYGVYKDNARAFAEFRYSF